MSVRWDLVDKSQFWGKPPEAAAAPTSTLQRWDAVVDKSRFCMESPLPIAVSTGPRDTTTVAASVPVKIWLYGELATLLPERPLVVGLPDGFTLGEVFADLSKRCGQEFRDAVIRPDGKKSTHCRVFVDGLPVDDLDTPVHVGSSPALVELIVISATEGG
jgi:hypothetical protein